MVWFGSDPQAASYHLCSGAFWLRQIQPAFEPVRSHSIRCQAKADPPVLLLRSALCFLPRWLSRARRSEAGPGATSCVCQECLLASRPGPQGLSESAELPASFSCKELLHRLFISKSLPVISILSQQSGSLLRFPHSLLECCTFLMPFFGDYAEEQNKHWSKSEYLPEGSFNYIMINMLDGY